MYDMNRWRNWIRAELWCTAKCAKPGGSFAYVFGNSTITPHYPDHLCIYIHFIPVHYIRLHVITLDYITLHCIALHYNTYNTYMLDMCTHQHVCLFCLLLTKHDMFQLYSCFLIHYSFDLLWLISHNIRSMKWWFWHLIIMYINSSMSSI